MFGIKETTIQTVGTVTNLQHRQLLMINCPSMQLPVVLLGNSCQLIMAQEKVNKKSCVSAPKQYL